MVCICVLGLYGAATSRWGMLATDASSGVHEAVWDSVAFLANGLIFFWAGIAAVNFVARRAGAGGRAGEGSPVCVCVCVRGAGCGARQSGGPSLPTAALLAAARLAAVLLSVPSRLPAPPCRLHPTHPTLTPTPHTRRAAPLLSDNPWSFAAIPLIYLFMYVARGLNILAFNPLFKLFGKGEGAMDALACTHTAHTPLPLPPCCLRSAFGAPGALLHRN